MQTFLRMHHLHPIIKDGLGFDQQQQQQNQINFPDSEMCYTFYACKLLRKQNQYLFIEKNTQ